MTNNETRKPPLLELALDISGKQVHISEVENGDACNCRCIYCGEPLTAKQGNGGKAPHFAHKPDSTCRWKEYVRQTDIHWRAEKIFLQEKEILLPRIIRTFGNIQCLMFRGGTFQITSVELEKRISDFIPDIVLQIGEATLLVEIFVTHAVDDVKKDKIRKDGRYDVIEIDLNDKKYDDITDDELRLLIKDQSRINWIYNRQEVYFTNNLASVANSYSIVADTNVVGGCPQGILSHSKRNISHCDRCQFYLGKSADNKTSCFYNAWFALNMGQQLPQLPPIWNVKRTYDQVVSPYSVRVSFPSRPLTYSTQRPYYDNRRMNPNKYRKLVNAGKIRL